MGEFVAEVRDKDGNLKQAFRQKKSRSTGIEKFQKKTRGEEWVKLKKGEKPVVIDREAVQ